MSCHVTYAMRMKCMPACMCMYVTAEEVLKTEALQEEVLHLLCQLRHWYSSQRPAQSLPPHQTQGLPYIVLNLFPTTPKTNNIIFLPICDFL